MFSQTPRYIVRTVSRPLQLRQTAESSAAVLRFADRLQGDEWVITYNKKFSTVNAHTTGVNGTYRS